MAGGIGMRARGGAILGAAVAGLVLLLALVVAVRSADAAFPGTNGRIAFQSDRDVAGGEIYSLPPTGGPATRLTFSNGSADPAYSPDGSRIAFISSKPTGTRQVWVMNADGSNPRQLTGTSTTGPTTTKQEPAWSPDGTKIAYVANSFDVDGQTDLEIWTINADGSGRKQLTNNSGGIPDTQPAWSPLGNKIAFVSARVGDTDRNVYVMDADGGPQTNITPSTPPPCSPCYQGHDDNPAWSPNGNRIAHVHGHTITGGGAPDIWTMDPNGDNKVNVSDNDAVAFTQPAWSPNGDKFAMVGAETTDRNIWAMNANGTGQTPINTNPATHDINPDWQPIPECTETGTAAGEPLNGTAAKDVICGLGGNDTLNGLAGNDILLGGPGNDVIKGSPGNDTMNGGLGTDVANYAASATGIKASLVTGFATGQGSDVLLGVENLTGSGVADVLAGSSLANLLFGGGGADTARGAGANDKVIGGSGPDKLFGDGGNDTVNSRDGVNGNDSVAGGTGTDSCITDVSELSVTGCP